MNLDDSRKEGDMARARIYIEYKYPEEPWTVYDWTQVPVWANTQMSRMVDEHPKAQHRLRKETKK